ncbi:hypothetical protein MVES1_002428 [Malassezia vespertilionis]|uniref:Secreted protein n=1 Tax=Malassezia vespertilionis TaxID=2020962 RepID=A0A2N1JBS6_9BASI|nr:uncharacterized protein MVES1_002428 [Malassezia vespertilionis]PKI83999.1 hypothetical protein MVES_002296 [Malassezia vespertilionis]WFD07072.1 hypothetical protein MVES1_002428 [Malassezia vespertilionis]
MFVTRAFVAIAAVVGFSQAGWITYQNENKKDENLPCVGKIWGNDNHLISQFDCNSFDWNGTMCRMKCFPISSTTCVGFPTEDEMKKGRGAGIWYSEHGSPDGCVYLGSTFGGNYDDRIGPNTTGCGYLDWPEQRNFGPVKSKPNGEEVTKGCWKTDMKPDSKYSTESFHYYDGARPLSDASCKSGFAKSCGPNEDPLCHFAPTLNQLECKKAKIPHNPENE